MRLLAMLPAVLLLAVPGAALAQENVDHAPLPPICTAGSMAGMKMGTDKPAEGGGMKMSTDAAHEALMAGMDEMQSGMAAGMQASDIDVAFVCGMIPHHQGAISMARAELKYGKDPANRRLAEEIIKAQEKEVAQMLDWLKRRSR
ncbi:MAG: CopM family metallochaperone [Devosia sp.]